MSRTAPRDAWDGGKVLVSELSKSEGCVMNHLPVGNG